VLGEIQNRECVIKKRVGGNRKLEWGACRQTIHKYWASNWNEKDNYN
jgi:hypothetical protein